MARSTSSLLRLLLLFGVVVCAVPAVAAQSATTQASRLAVPSGPRVQEARSALDELCAARLHGTSAVTPAQLAAELLSKSQGQRDDSAYAFVLLERARSLALSSSNGPLALRATRAVAEMFQLDAFELFRDTLNQLSAREVPALLVVHQAIRQSLLAIEQERYDLAIAFASIAQRSAARSHDPHLLQQAEAAAFDANCGRNLVASFDTAATQASTTKPSGRKSSTTKTAASPQARYLLFYRRDCEAGLPMLALSNGPLADLAVRERSLDRDADAIAACADEWWSAAPHVPELPTWRVRRHAADLYAKALPRLSGVKQDLVEKRIADARIDQLAAQGYAVGVVMDVVKDDNDPGDPGSHSIGSDVILPGDDLPHGNYTLRCSGYIDVPVEGAYEFLYVAGSGAKLAIDGKSLVDDPAFYRKRSGEHFMLQLTQGLHELAAEIHVASGKPKMQLTWRRPGHKEFSPIPTSSLYHEDE